MFLSSHMNLSLSLFTRVSLSLFTCVCLSLFTCVCLSLPSYVFLSSHLSSSLLFLLFSFSLTHDLCGDNDHSFSRLSLSVRKSLTCPESQSARALAHSLVSELLASCRKNLYRCSGCCGCGFGCGGCVSCVCCVLRPFKEIHGYSCRLPALVRNSHRVDIRSTTQNSHSINNIRGHHKENTKKTRTMKPRRPRVVSNVP